MRLILSQIPSARKTRSALANVPGPGRPDGDAFACQVVSRADAAVRKCDRVGNAEQKPLRQLANWLGAFP